MEQNLESLFEQKILLSISTIFPEFNVTINDKIGIVITDMYNIHCYIKCKWTNTGIHLKEITEFISTTKSLENMVNPMLGIFASKSSISSVGTDLLNNNSNSTIQFTKVCGNNVFDNIILIIYEIKKFYMYNTKIDSGTNRRINIILSDWPNHNYDILQKKIENNTLNQDLRIELKNKTDGINKFLKSSYKNIIDTLKEDPKGYQIYVQFKNILTKEFKDSYFKMDIRRCHYMLKPFVYTKDRIGMSHLDVIKIFQSSVETLKNEINECNQIKSQLNMNTFIKTDKMIVYVDEQKYNDIISSKYNYRTSNN